MRNQKRNQTYAIRCMTGKRRARKGENEHPVQMNQAYAGNTMGCDLDWEEQKVKRPRGC